MTDKKERLRGSLEKSIRLSTCQLHRNGDTVGQHRHDRSRLLKGTASTSRSGGTSFHRSLFCSCLQETASRAFSATSTSVRARLKMFTDRSGINARASKPSWMCSDTAGSLSSSNVHGIHGKHKTRGGMDGNRTSETSTCTDKICRVPASWFGSNSWTSSSSSITLTGRPGH